MFDDLLVAVPGDFAGDGETDSLVRTTDDGRVDADHLALQIYERSTAVAGIHGGIGLQEILDRVSLRDLRRLVALMMPQVTVRSSP